ncbi:MAG: YicC family protein [Planctomycetes bacterium]|nr:YicC family protein [Planctomycetota bacterium]MBI3844891.1 YicC family protein [Planctomycetota bacterium]
MAAPKTQVAMRKPKPAAAGIVRSMTGFGKSTRTGESWSVTAEIRSVNHRFLKVTLKLPGALQAYDARIEDIVKRRVARGSVTLAVRYESANARAVFHVDPASVRGYVDALRNLKETYDLSGEPSLELVADMPGIFQSNGAAELPANEWTAIQEAVGEAVDRLVAMRETEGSKLTSEIRDRQRAIGKTLAQVKKRAPRVVREYHDKLRERASALLQSSPLAIKEEDLRRDVAIFADRCDVTEEIARLDSHLAQFESVIASGREVGRRLDFLLQEVFREVNTIGSKASDAEIAHAVVEAKAEIEKIREQVQNLE